MNKLATMQQLDALERMELRSFNEKVDRNRREKERLELVTELVRERSHRREEAQRHREELNGMMTFISVMAVLVIMIACALSSAPWTVVLAIALMVAVMWKGGWIG